MINGNGFSHLQRDVANAIKAPNGNNLIIPTLSRIVCINLECTSRGSARMNITEETNESQQNNQTQGPKKIDSNLEDSAP